MMAFKPTRITVSGTRLGVEMATGLSVDELMGSWPTGGSYPLGAHTFRVEECMRRTDIDEVEVTFRQI